jgi:hypothetical protein
MRSVDRQKQIQKTFAPASHGSDQQEASDRRNEMSSETLWAEWLRSGGCQPRQKHFDDDVLVVCPRCGSDWVVPVMYGHPSEAAEEAARRGALAMGGCCMPRPSQRNHWCCKSCKFRWPGEFEDWDADLPVKSSNH